MTTDSETTSRVNASAQNERTRNYRAIFFDLDGTLLPMELEDFLKNYYRLLGEHVAAHGFDAELFAKGLNAGVQAMITHEDHCLNAQAFWRVFYQFADEQALDWQAVLNDFYENRFGSIGTDSVANPAAQMAIETLQSKGYPLVLTTMPLFPERAVRWRLEWAGVKSDAFSRVTHYENSTAVKPFLSYYAENLAACGIAGEDVLMVGNNTVEDLAVKGLGSDVYLITDCLIDPIDFDITSVKHGTLAEFASWVQALPPCSNPAFPIDTTRIDDKVRERVLAQNLVDETLESAPLRKAAVEATDTAAKKVGVPHSKESK